MLPLKASILLRPIFKNSLIWASWVACRAQEYSWDVSRGFGIMFILNNKKGISLNYNVLGYNYWLDTDWIPVFVEGEVKSIQLSYYF